MVKTLLQQADEARLELNSKSHDEIGHFLRTIADGIDNLSDDFVSLAVKETALPDVRINGERARTTDQLRKFASLVEEGSWVDARINWGGGKDLRRMLFPLGPVAVFGASNFPLAFSVAGGDTAAALAAKNPVIVKAHPAHPGVSEVVADVIQDAVRDCAFPSGTFSMLQSTSPNVAQSLVSNPLLAAVGFTGSLRVGRALMDCAAARDRPIPVYAEMGSVNPIFIMPHAMETRWEAIANGLCGSLTLGTGQFCTNPGLIVVSKHDRLGRFKEHLARAVDHVPSGTMLTHGIRDQFLNILEHVSNESGVEKLTKKPLDDDDCDAAAKVPGAVFSVSASKWIQSKLLQEEMFGPATLIVECENESEMLRVAKTLDGQLTASIFGSNDDVDTTRSAITRALCDRVGRLIYNDWPTGVEVCDAMVHGGTCVCVCVFVYLFS